MKFYISATGIKKVTISNSGTGKVPPKTTGNSVGRRHISRNLLPVVLVLAIVLPFLFVRVAFLVLESATVCSSLGKFTFHFPCSFPNFPKNVFPIFPVLFILKISYPSFFFHLRSKSPFQLFLICIFFYISILLIFFMY